MLGASKRIVMYQCSLLTIFSFMNIGLFDSNRFTAWSSTREPAQVFRLLETVYFHFDQIADRRRVFKVETVG